MTDEAAAVPAAAPPAAVVAPRIERIGYGIRDLTSVGVIQKINECVSHNKQSWLDLYFDTRFDATGAMQNTIVENSRHIKEIVMHNYCSEKAEHIRCFTFFIRIVEGIIGNGKYIRYHSYRHGFEFELEQANQLAQALQRSNNNNDNNAIESFSFHECQLTPVALQPVLDALLDSGVRKISFGNTLSFTSGPPINYNNSNINFTGIETNESLKELDLPRFDMREEDYQSLFNSMKLNKGLIKLRLDYNTYKDLPTRMKKLFEEMLSENITLLDCSFCQDEDDPIFETIQFHMIVNRMMKQYMKKRNTKSTVATMPARAGVATRTRARTRASTVEATNKKKRLKMRLFLNLFIHKPVLRDSIIFNLLRDYPDDLMGTDFHRRMDVHDRDDDDRGNNNCDDGTDCTL